MPGELIGSLVTPADQSSIPNPFELGLKTFTKSFVPSRQNPVVTAYVPVTGLIKLTVKLPATFLTMFKILYDAIVVTVVAPETTLKVPIQRS